MTAIDHLLIAPIVVPAVTAPVTMLVAAVLILGSVAFSQRAR